MTRTLAVVTAGLSDPSSTSLLGSRLADATSAALRSRGDDVLVEVIDLRPLAHDLANNMLTGFAGGELARAQATIAGADAVIAVTLISVRPTRGCSRRSSTSGGRLAGRRTRADGRDRRYRPALAGAGARIATVVRLPEGHHRADRGLRRHRGLGRCRLRCALRADRPGRRRAGRPRRVRRSGPFQTASTSVDDFEDLLRGLGG